MRTTVTLDDQLLREAKSLAARTGVTLNSVIENALREALARRNAGTRREKVTLRTFRGHGLQPGVDLNDSAALLDLMNGIE